MIATNRIRLEIAGQAFEGALDAASAPHTCAAIIAMLPYVDQVIHARWSGEACWVALSSLHFDIPWENPTSFPAPGQLLLFPGGVSEPEILIAYGPTRFACKAGTLAGNPFLHIIDGIDRLAAIGRATLMSGAASIRFSRLD